jgi:prophage maintenance system killer protein
MVAYVFLGLNGKDLEADEPDVVRTVEPLAAGRLTETALAKWLRTHIQPLA